MTFWYLASPYSHSEAHVRDARARAVAKVAGHLLAKGVAIFCPIAHGHAIQTVHELPWTHEEWLKYDAIYLKMSCGIFVAELPGWRQSRGVAWEMNWAKTNNLVITHIPEAQVQEWIGPKLFAACDG